MTPYELWHKHWGDPARGRDCNSYIQSLVAAPAGAIVGLVMRDGEDRAKLLLWLYPVAGLALTIGKTGLQHVEALRFDCGVVADWDSVVNEKHVFASVADAVVFASGRNEDELVYQLRWEPSLQADVERARVTVGEYLTHYKANWEV